MQLNKFQHKYNSISIDARVRQNEQVRMKAGFKDQCNACLVEEEFHRQEATRLKALELTEARWAEGIVRVLRKKDRRARID